MKILELTFESAQALFHDYVKKYKDGSRNTHDFQDFKNTVQPRMRSKTYIPHNNEQYNPYIDAHSLANILCVLINEPTVSRLKYKKKRKMNEQCLEYAKKAHITITKENRDLSFFSHKFNFSCWSKGSVNLDDGSASTGGIISWERMESFLGEDFKLLTDLVEKVLKVDSYKSLSFNDVVNQIRKKKDLKCVQNFCSYLKAKSKSPLSNLLCEDFKKGTAFAMAYTSPGVARRIRGGIHSNVHSIDGVIRIPVEDSFVKLLTKGPGDATILEGGLVYISKISPYKAMPESNVFSGKPKQFFTGKIGKSRDKKEKSDVSN